LVQAVTVQVTQLLEQRLHTAAAAVVQVLLQAQMVVQAAAEQAVLLEIQQAILARLILVQAAVVDFTQVLGVQAVKVVQVMLLLSSLTLVHYQ
jgi:hypothetical protein